MIIRTLNEGYVKAYTDNFKSEKPKVNWIVSYCGSLQMQGNFESFSQRYKMKLWHLSYRFKLNSMDLMIITIDYTIIIIISCGW